MDESTLRREAQALLRDLGPMSPVELGRRLLMERGPDSETKAGADSYADTTGSDVDADTTDRGNGTIGDEAIGDPRWLWSVLLDESVDGDEFSAYPLADGRLCDLDDLLEGLTLTHRMSDEERRGQVVSFEVDLGPLSVLSPDGRTHPLIDGEAVTDHSSDDWQLTGPPGWLPDAPVVVARVVGGRIELTGHDELPPVDMSVVERLEQVLEATRALQDGVDEVDLIIEARARFPRLLSAPSAPLSELLAAAGLRSTDLGLLHEDEPDDGWDGELEIEDLIAHLRDDHDLDVAEIAVILGVKLNVETLSNHVLTASLERIRATDELDDLDDLERDDRERDEMAAITLDALEAVDLEEAGEQLELVFADTGLAAAVVEDVVGSEPLAAAMLLALLETCRPALSGRIARANDAWVRSRVLELTADDHAEAERELRRAHELDEQHLWAALDLANYRSDRGQAGAALGLLRRIGLEHLAGFERLLARYAAPGPTSAGRNEPCPCGSGRKHKVCCQARNGWPLQDRLPWVWEKINSFAASPRAADLAEPIERVAGASGRPGADDRDVAVANLTLFEGGGLQAMCELRGSLLPADELELLRAWSEVRARLYELVDTGAGDRMTFLDLTSGDRVTFVDHAMAASGLPAGTAVLAWLVPEPEGPAPSIGGVIVADGRREGLLDLLDDQPSATELAVWYRGLSAPPRLANTAGDPLVLTTLVYTVPDEQAARAALAEHLDDDGDALNAFEEPGDGQRWLKGSVTVGEGALTVSVNSAPRAAWFEALIAEVVPDAELVDVERLPAADVAALAGQGPGGDPDDRPDEDDGGLLDLDSLDPGSRRQFEEELEAMMRRHEDAWVDTPLPVLHGATPREAVDDPTRREELLRVLDDIGRHAATWSSPGRPMDAARLRELLGL